MSGRPVWLASMTRRKKDGRIIPTPRWSPAQMRAARKAIYERVLAGVGDEARERGFRMNATLCVHRALSDAEIAALPDGWMKMPAIDVAGGPVEVLWRTPLAIDAPSTRPCVNPTRMPLPGTNDPDLWVPVDCGACEPCRARDACVEAKE
jgi:hypothetical protein